MKKELFDPKVIYFGLCNSPKIFQWLINSIFQELLYKEVLTNYMDDFVILMKTKKELKEKTIQFLKIVESIIFASNDQNAISMSKKYLS